MAEESHQGEHEIGFAGCDENKALGTPAANSRQEDGVGVLALAPQGHEGIPLKVLWRHRKEGGREVRGISITKGGKGRRKTRPYP